MPVQFRLIVGLGNPGREYDGTRHNVGFMVLDKLATAANVNFRTEKSWQADVARSSEALLCKPMGYMNLSGEAVRCVADFYKVGSGEVLVVLDDMALPLGKLRLRENGTAGGHNGLQSIIDHLGTTTIPRLRIGIGAAEPGDATRHVLGRFGPDEIDPLNASLDRAIAAIECAQKQGFTVAMNSYN